MLKTSNTGYNREPTLDDLKAAIKEFDRGDSSCIKVDFYNERVGSFIPAQISKIGSITEISILAYNNGSKKMIFYYSSGLYQFKKSEIDYSYKKALKILTPLINNMNAYLIGGVA